MKLLYVCNVPEYFCAHRLPVALGAQRKGYEIHVATAEGAAVKTIKKLGFVHHPIPFRRWEINLFHEIKTLWSLCRLYRKIKPDLTHHITIKPVIYGSIAARLTGAPRVVNAISGLGYVFSVNDLKTKILRPLVVLIYKLAYGHPCLRLIVENPDDGRFFVSAGLIRNENVVMVQGVGVDMERFRATPEPEGPVRVVLPSRMLWDKGVGEFVEAARLLNTQEAKAWFALAGGVEEGNPTAIEASQLEAWKQEGVVDWLGHCEDMSRLFSEFHLVCLPSYREGLPLVLAEAASCGRAIVTTDAPGCREIVRDGHNGLLVPIKNAEALANAMKTLIEDPELRRQMGRRGREMVEKEFSVERVVDKTLNVYQDLIACRQS